MERKIYFYAKTGGFYDSAVHGENIPDGAIEITELEHRALIEGQAAGKVIKADAAGKPYLADQPAKVWTPEEIAAAVTAARATAYRNEADPLFFKAQRGEATTEQWLEKVAEIKARYPDGVIPQ